MTDHERPETGGDYIHGYEWDRAGAPPGAVRVAHTARRWSGRRTGQAVGLVAAGLVAGVLVVGAWPSGGSASDASNTSSAGTAQGGQHSGGSPGDGQQPAGPGEDGGLRPDPGSGSGGGGLDGEQRLSGTVTAVSRSSLTFRASDGTTATYTLDVRTLVVKDGVQASVGDVKAGDSAHVHVYPQGGTTVVERIFVGALPDFGGDGGAGPGGSGGSDGSDDSGPTTTARSV